VAPSNIVSVPARQPAAVRHCAELDAIAARVVGLHQAAPGAVVACAWASNGSWTIDQGAAGHLAPGADPVTPDAIYDLASVTKPFVAVTLARLVRSGPLTLDTRLDVLVRESLSTPSASVSLELLLAHRSGLEGHRPLYAPLVRGSIVNRFLAIGEAARARRPECDGDPPAEGFDPIYSDLGFLLLGEAISRGSGAQLDAAVAAEVCAPLGIGVASARQWRLRGEAFDERVAPTEVVPWRGGVVRGAVHDENAWALGGEAMCGHAGLFGTARDVAQFGAALVDVVSGRAASWLSSEEFEPLIRVRAGGTLRAGFDGKSDVGSSAGASCSPRSFGHLGFTGTSLWIDPEQRIAVAILSNRVHPTREGDAIKRARPDVNESLFAWGRSQQEA